ncbi:MAG TPA: hypothetical protein VF175_04655 [Lacipirellula sp.]
MRRLEKCLSIAAAACFAGLAAPEPCHGVVLNDAYFTASGGDGYVDWIRTIYPVAQLYYEDLNGIDAGINDDRVVSSPGDTSAFIARRRERSLANGPNPADLNQGGLVNLPDAYLLHNALSAVGKSFDFSLLSTPEPSSMDIWLAVLGWLPAAHRRPMSAIGA